MNSDDKKYHGNLEMSMSIEIKRNFSGFLTSQIKDQLFLSFSFLHKIIDQSVSINSNSRRLVDCSGSNVEK